MFSYGAICTVACVLTRLFGNLHGHISCMEVGGSYKRFHEQGADHEARKVRREVLLRLQSLGNPPDETNRESGGPAQGRSRQDRRRQSPDSLLRRSCQSLAAAAEKPTTADRQDRRLHKRRTRTRKEAKHLWRPDLYPDRFRPHNRRNPRNRSIVAGESAKIVRGEENAIPRWSQQVSRQGRTSVAMAGALPTRARLFRNLAGGEEQQRLQQGRLQQTFAPGA